MRPRPFPERTLVMTKRITTPTTPAANNNKEKGWNRNTALGVDLKTLLSSDRVMIPAKEYRGVLRRDTEIDDFYFDEHYSFIETVPQSGGKRNPRVFDGEFITVPRWHDGSLHPNFKPTRMGSDFSVDGYAIGVMDELRQALEGLVGK